MKYKIGDRVKFIGSSLTIPYGEMGVVKGFVPRSSNIPIELDHEVSYHECYGLTRPKRGWWVEEKDIELVKPAEREFKLIIVSEGDTTTAKLLHGKTIEKEAAVTRYHKDEYSEKAAVEAVVKKLFGEEEKETENKPKYFNGRAVMIGYYPNFTKGKIYTFYSGNCVNDKGVAILLQYTERQMGMSTQFVPIVE